MAEFFVEHGESGLLVVQGGELFFQGLFLGGAGAGVDVLFELVGVAIELGAERDDVQGAHARQGAGVVAVQIHQALEGLLFAGAEQPVDRALFVGLQVIFEEAAAQITAQGIAAAFAFFR